MTATVAPNPTRTPQPVPMRILRQLVTESEAAGITHIAIADIATALDHLEQPS